ncbi:MAG TPA: hypothetical protein VGX78_13610 [Pirellulales bacterium]|nr:hypothetical protein [Pirellulales bacterium]
MSIDTSLPAAGNPKWRMTLGSLFLLQLFISPLFLSVALIRWSAGRDPQEFVPFLNTLACAAVYAAIFAGRSGIKRRSGPRCDGHWACRALV